MLIAGLRKAGMVAPSPLSLGPMALQWQPLDGPVNGDWFEAYVRHSLIPGLRPGDVIIMGNLSSPNRAAVRERIEAAGARLLFLPNGPSMVSGTPSASSSTASRPKNARTTSPPADTMQIDRKTLYNTVR